LPILLFYRYELQIILTRVVLSFVCLFVRCLKC